jgi:tetratricopeptide (TPR) repeat protein
LDAAIGYGMSAPSIGYLRGNTLKFLGRLDEAALEYEKSLAISPDFAYAHWAQAFLGPSADTGSRLDRLRHSLAAMPTTHPDRPYLHYAMYKELENVGDDAGAWQSLKRGFRRKRAQLDFDAGAETHLFDRLIAAFPTPISDTSDAQPRGCTPVFVLGLPRTGTTLLERIVGGHPDIVLGGELNDFRMQFKWSSNYYCPGFFDAQALDRLPAIDHGELGRRYLDHVAWRAPGARMLTDKNPGNFMMAGLILQALPQAKIIHLRRNPMDSCFSNLKELFAASAHPYSYDFTDLATHYRNYRRLMKHWQTVAPGRILDVHYEDMVSKPETQARRVMEYLGLDYRETQIRVENSLLPVSTASSAQVRQPIHTRNIGGWKRYARPLAPLQAMLDEV